ncbi:glycosyltransferase family 2 protein [Synechococcus sp. MU1617]|uniref:glycosyltransferase family 2 protein n=1 Tax=Synechococcus sp. MU1617 TaxID=2508346 RepID=UPI001CF87C8B|nr:glycosyltransferase family 2 protein [Synechococcus sp. MU1617]MCB4389472.1 glycosyltransferase family 2 protein [Synechococcus sp. MU1617]
MSKVAVIPAYNESASLKSVIESISQYFDHIIVIDDCSSDDTFSIASDKGCIVHSNSRNLGYDRSILIGLKLAIKLSPSIIMTLDADGQHPATSIPLIIQHAFSRNCDVLLCSRNKFPRFSETLSSYLSRLIYNCPDLFTGMKCYCRRSLELIPSPCLWDSVGTYYAFLSLNRSLTVESFSITCSKRVGSSRFGSSMRSEFKILKAFCFGLFRAL